MSANKKAYFQGGGGVNEPTPGEKKYKSDPALVVQPRFEEPFYQNYDLYTIPGFENVGPGTGYHGLQNYDSVQEFLEARRNRMKGRYVADDSWQLDSGKRTKENPGIKARAAIFERIVKSASPNYDLGKGLYQEMSDGKVDSVEEFRKETDHGPGALMNITKKKNNKYDIHHIDFPIDDQISESLGGPMGEEPETDNPVGESNLTGGYLDEYTPEPDFEGKLPTELDFGRDYTDQDDVLEKLINKYLPSSEPELFGLPDGIEPDSDLDAEQTINTERPFEGTSDIGTGMFDEDTWVV